MKEINEVVVESIQNYFYELALNGYRRQASVHKLLALQYIIEILQGNLRFYVTREDYRALSKALYCIYGSDCLIPYPQFEIGNREDGYGQLQPRISELTDYRSSTGYPVRFAKQ